MNTNVNPTTMNNSIPLAETDMTTGVEVISPDKAAYILKNDHDQRLVEGRQRNRPLDEAKVKEYASIMKRGGWDLTHQGIAISPSGILIDGQHRLHATIRAGIPLRVNVSRNADPATFKNLDVGKKRTASDVFAIEGIPSYTRHASGVNKYLDLKYKGEQFSSGNSRRAEHARTHGDALDFYWENESFLKKVFSMSDKYYSQFRIFSPSILYAFIIIMHKDRGHSMDKVETFFDNVYMIKNNCISTAPKLLFKKLMADMAGPREMKPKVKHALLIKSWNFFLEGRKVSILKFSQEQEEFPVIK